MKILSKKNLFDENSGNLIYHYTKRDIAIEKIFPTNQLKFNPPCNTNDPLEFESYHFRFQQELTNKVLDIQEEINKVIKQNYKMCCFSMDKDNSSIYSKGFFRPRMWSQYGDNHKGICLIFKKDEFYYNLFKSIKSINVSKNLKMAIINREITYDNQLQNLRNILSIKVRGNPKNFTKRFIEMYIDKLLFTKLEDYKDESEYRYAVHSNSFIDKNEIYINISNTLEGIILGTKFPKEYVVNIFNYSEETGIPVFSMTWENGVPSIDTIKTRPINSEKYEESIF